MQQEPYIPTERKEPQQPGYNFSPNTTPPPSRPKKKDGWKSVLSTISILVLAPLVAIGLTTYVFQSYEVDGPSMEETLQDQDRLIVWKVPHTIAQATDDDYIPARGDIIVFNQSESSGALASYDSKQLIKRVVALPGERVTIKNNAVTIYNEDHPSGFNPDTTGDYSDTPIQTSGKIDLVVPESQVFVLGDNRPNSLDSRVFGPIHSDEIVGKLTFRIFPFNQIRTF